MRLAVLENALIKDYKSFKKKLDGDEAKADVYEKLVFEFNWPMAFKMMRFWLKRTLMYGFLDHMKFQAKLPLNLLEYQHILKKQFEEYRGKFNGRVKLLQKKKGKKKKKKKAAPVEGMEGEEVKGSDDDDDEDDELEFDDETLDFLKEFVEEEEVVDTFEFSELDFITLLPNMLAIQPEPEPEEPEVEGGLQIIEGEGD